MDVDTRAAVPSRPEHDHEDAGTVVSYRRSERTSLLVETQEGDTVRLKIRASESLSVTTGQTEADDDDGVTIAGLELQARSQTRISFRVRGDLNEQEMAAIQDVIAQAGAMAEDFFAGETEAAFATAASLQLDATQLANARISMKTSEQLSYALPNVLPRQPAAAVPAGEDVAGESPVPATSEPTGDAASPTAETVATAAATGDTVAAVPADDGTVEQTETVGNVSNMASAIQSIGVFLNRLMDAFGSDAAAGAGNVPADSMALKLQMFRSMLLSVSDLQQQSEEKEPAATALLADTLDTLTARETPLDLVA